MPIYKTKIKKDGIYQYRIVVNYTDHAGNYCKKETTAYGQAAAKDKEYYLTQELKGGTAASATVGQLAAEYLKAKKPELKESSHHKISRTLDKHILPYLESIKLDKLNARALQEWKMKIEQF